jgi:tRNA 2-thiouridine synthesizing protein A
MVRLRSASMSSEPIRLPEQLDLCGEVCPYTFVRTKLRLEELPVGTELHVLVDHAPAAESVPRSLRAEGQEVVSVAQEGAHWRIVTIKRREPRSLARKPFTP